MARCWLLSTVYLLCIKCQPAVDHQFVLACGQLLLLDNLQTHAQMQVAWTDGSHLLK